MLDDFLNSLGGLLWGGFLIIVMIGFYYFIGNTIFKELFKIAFGYSPNQKPKLTHHEKLQREKQEKEDGKARMDYMELQNKHHL